MRSAPSSNRLVRELNLDSIGKQIEISEDAPLFTQGSPASCIYIIKEGVVRISLVLADGQRQVVGFALPGNLVGFQGGQNYEVSADAITPVRAHKISVATLFDKKNAESDVRLALLELLRRELTLVNKQLAIFGYRSPAQRIAYFLLLLQERWAPIIGFEKSIPMPMKRQDVADFLRLRLETVSRTISQMAREKLIESEPGFIHINRTALTRLLSGVTDPVGPTKNGKNGEFGSLSRKTPHPSLTDVLNNSDYLRRRAEEARTAADGFTSPAARETMRRIAENYESLAGLAEIRANPTKPKLA